MPEVTGEWRKLVEPIVKKCRLSVSLDMNTSFTPDGSSALADLLVKLADALDGEPEPTRSQALED